MIIMNASPLIFRTADCVEPSPIASVTVHSPGVNLNGEAPVPERFITVAAPEGGVRVSVAAAEEPKRQLSPL